VLRRKSKVSSLTLTTLENFPLIRRDDNLADILVKSLYDTEIELKDGDILVIAQKIVSKAEGRMVDLTTVTPSQRALELAKHTQKDPRVVELILRESKEVVRTRIGTIIVEHRLGFMCANAGIDHSNVDSPLPMGERSGVRAEDWVLLLPQDPDLSAGQDAG
jgi:coenzyme F420-0:L-glutamate ligase / coenzyme F420-1:gamma-L-glutamate ligase